MVGPQHTSELESFASETLGPPETLLGGGHTESVHGSRDPVPKAETLHPLTPTHRRTQEGPKDD